MGCWLGWVVEYFDRRLVLRNERFSMGVLTSVFRRELLEYLQSLLLKLPPFGKLQRGSLQFFRDGLQSTPESNAFF